MLYAFGPMPPYADTRVVVIGTGGWSPSFLHPKTETRPVVLCLEFGRDPRW